MQQSANVLVFISFNLVGENFIGSRRFIVYVANKASYIKVKKEVLVLMQITFMNIVS